MKKSWLSEPGGLQLQAFLGARGIRTSEIEDSTGLIMRAAEVFEIPMAATCEAMAAAINALPRRQRRALARKNIAGDIAPPTDLEAAGRPALPQQTASGEKSREAKLLHQVVMAVINAGQSDLLCGIDDLNAYYNCQIPTVADVIGGRPETAIVTGDISFDDKVYSFRCARTIRA